MKHIVLLGDSIFDNGAYVNHNEPDVASQVKNELGQTDKVTLLAKDGDLTNDITNQLDSLPEDTTHIFISVGGNDALGELNSLTKSVNTVGEGFHEFYSIRTQFEDEYNRMLSSVVLSGLPTVVCTIYDPCFYHNNDERIGNYMAYGVGRDTIQEVAVTALPIFNDIITRQAVIAEVPVMDFRLIFNNESDYANSIEPSAAGGLKISKVIKKIVYNHNFNNNCMVYCS